MEFAKEFETWCKRRGVEPKIDVLLIDTSHMCDYSIQELEAWLPFMAKHSKVFLHDTNLNEVCFLKDGTMVFGWVNDRGVIRAVEQYFNATFNEKAAFVDFRNGWLIKHYPYSYGFTILEKIEF